MPTRPRSRAATPRACSPPQALPGARHHQCRARRHRHRHALPRARSDAADRHAACWSMARSPIRTVDIFDREAVFIERVLDRHRPRLPGAQDRVRAYHHRRGASPSSRARARTSPRRSRRSICLINRNAMFEGGIRPHAYCLPVAKRELHRLAVAQGRDLGLAEILPRHRQRAARDRAQGGRMRLRRHLQRAVRARNLCDGVRRGRRARQVGGVRLDQRRHISTACRSTRSA